MSKKYDFFEIPEKTIEKKKTFETKETLKTIPKEIKPRVKREIKEKEKEKKVIKEIVKEIKIPLSVFVPELDEMMRFCKEHLDDDECMKFLEHTLRRREYQEIFKKQRGGGGWSGAVLGTLAILRKMNEKKKH